MSIRGGPGCLWMGKKADGEDWFGGILRALGRTEYQPGIRMDFRQSKIQRCLEMGSGQKRCAVAASLVTAFVGWSQSGQLVLQVD
jgi:hypothetical protein